MSIVPNLIKKIKEYATFDLRSLALFRVYLGLMILFDLYVRSKDLYAHYTDGGIAPRDIFIQNFANQWHYSFHLACGKEYFQIFLFLVAAFFAICLMFGYKTRLASIISWIFFVSLSNRNYEILSGADILLKMTLFWSIFLPLGNYYSIDRALSTNKDDIPIKYTSGGVLGFIIQMSILYYFTGILKTGDAWVKDYTAVYYALRLEEFATPFAFFMLKFPDLLKVMTKYVLQLEIYGSLLFFIPIYTSIFRTIGALLFMCLQIGFGLCLSIGMFPFIGVCVMIPLLPTWFWENIVFKFIKFDQTKLTMHYDGCCNFCKKLTLILKEFLILKNAEVIPASENPDIQKIMDENNSWVVSKNDSNYIKFDGIITIFKSSPVFFPLAFIFKLPIIKDIGKSIYEYVASNRKLFTVLTKNLDFGELRKGPNLFFETLIPLFFTAIVLLWNFSELENSSIKFPNSLKPLVHITRVDQKWNMFAKYPRRDNGWYVIPGTLRNGKEVDLFKDGAPVSWEKPKLISSTFKNNRWRKLMTNYRKKDKDKHRLAFGKYLCRSWNSTHKGDESLETFKVYFMKDIIQPDFKLDPTKKTLLWRHYCFKKPAEWEEKAKP